MSEFTDQINDCPVTVKLTAYTELGGILWADDILLLSESEKGLREMLLKLESFCHLNKLNVNVDKTKCMIFNKAGRRIHRKFYYKGVLIEHVNVYKYLGFMVSASGSISKGLEDLRDRALKAFMKIRQGLGNLFNKSIKHTLRILVYMVKPILLYASDFWGCYKLPENNPIDKLFNSIYRQLLGVQKNTTTIGVLLELGQVPLSLSCVKAAIKNWERLRAGKGSPLILLSYKNAINKNLKWIPDVKNYLQYNGMLKCFIKPDKNVHNKLFHRLSEIFHQNAFNTITSQHSKLRTYGKIKKHVGFEEYLTDVTNVEHRVAMTKLKLSNHKLVIEVGRHDNIDINNRLCPSCSVIESGSHFLLSCSLYSDLRKHLLPMTINDY